MADMRRVRVQWTTGPGGVGLSTFYTAAADDATASLGTFFNAVKSYFPTAVTWTIPSSGDKIDSSNGALTGSWTGGTGASITGSPTTANYAAGTGVLIEWGTGLIIGRRRLKGKTFMVPVTVNGYSTSGVVDSTLISTFQSAANALVATNKIVVWHRPHPGGSDGSFITATSATVATRVTSLASRKV